MSPLRAALPSRSRSSPSPLLDAVHSGDLAALRPLYEHEAAGRSPLEVWRDAAARHRHDLQHAVLVLHQEQDVEWTLAYTPREGGAPALPNGELHRPLTSGAHASLVEHAKRFPYYSEKPDRISLQNLNGKATFGPEPGSKEIVCRHLALAWALQLEATGKPDYTALRDVDSIQRSVPLELDAQIDHLQQAGTDSHIVAASDWGRFIADQLRGLEAAGGTGAKRMIVATDDHAMALELKVKREPSGPRYVANFYDPNLTAAHKRVANSNRDLQGFEALYLEDMGVTEGFQAHFGEWPAAFVVGVPPGGAAAIPQPKPGGDPERRLLGPVPPLDVPVMHYLMANGFAGTLRDILPSFVARVKDDPALAAHLLSAESEALGGTPGLQQALFNGNAHVIRAVCALAEAAALPDAALESLLAARDSAGMTGIAPAMGLGHSEAVRAFIDAVAASGLPTASQLTLLDARSSPSEASVLAQAVQIGNVETVQAFLDGIRAHPALSADDKFHLLARGASKGAQVVRLGLQLGSPEAIAALVDGTTRLGLGAADQCTLLRGTDQRGMSALADAIQAGATANVKAFADAVLASSLSSSDKVDVLRLGRWGADVSNSQAALGAYQHAVRDSSLPPSAQKLLLADVRSSRRARLT